MSQHTAVLAPSARVPPELTPAASGTAPLVIMPSAVCESEARRETTRRLAADVGAATGARVLVGEAQLSGDVRGILWLDTGVKHLDTLEDALTRFPRISWVGVPMAGCGHYGPVMRRFPDKIWTSAKGAYAQPVAEHALALALALLRNLPTRIRATSWGPATGLSLFGLRVTVLGAGGITLSLLSLLAPFKNKVTVLRRRADEGLEPSLVPAGLDVTVGALAELKSILPETDVLIIACALTPLTKHVIGAAELALMKPSSILVNVARGEHVVTPALVNALREGRIAGAGIDVTDPEPLPEGHELWTLESSHPDVSSHGPGGGAERANLIITPHTADTPEMVAPLLAQRFKRNALALSKGDGEFEGVVDVEQGY